MKYKERKATLVLPAGVHCCWWLCGLFHTHVSHTNTCVDHHLCRPRLSTCPAQEGWDQGPGDTGVQVARLPGQAPALPLAPWQSAGHQGRHEPEVLSPPVSGLFRVCYGCPTSAFPWHLPDRPCWQVARLVNRLKWSPLGGGGSQAGGDGAGGF